MDEVEYYEFVENAMMIGIPWAILGGLCVVWNLWFNADLNRWWADGQWWLVLNTFWILFAYFDSLGVIFEWPIFIRTFRVTRIIALVGAVVYNFSFLMGFFEWWDQLYLVSDKTQYDFGVILLNMLLGYNIWLHGSIIPINLAIIIKEITLNYWSAAKFDDDGRD